MRKRKGLKLEGQHCLSSIQKEVLHLLTKEYMSPVKIANYRHTSLNAVYKIIKNLEKKGVYNHEIKQGLKSRCGNQGTIELGTNNEKIRLHAQEFNIKLLSKTSKYDSIGSKNNVLIIDDNTIRLFINSIEIYSGKSFFAETTNEATAKSFNYWNYFFKRLENDLNILIVKDRYSNINLVKSHYSYINNDLAKQCNEEKVKIQVTSTKDGKVWFLIDNSFNLHEAETTHKETSKQDMQNVIAPYFNDLRDKEFLLPSQTKQVLEISQKQINEIGAGLNILIKLLTPQQVKEQQQDEPLNNDYIM